MKQTFDLSAIGLKECHFMSERYGDDIVFAAKAADGARIKVAFAFAEDHPYVVYRVTQFGKRPVYLGLEAELLSRGFFLEETPFGGYRINTEKIFDHMEKESSLI